MLYAEIDGNIPHNRESESILGIGIKLYPVGREGSIITENEALKNIKQILENYINTMYWYTKIATPCSNNMIY